MNTLTSPTDGCLLFAHGARDATWARPFMSVQSQLQAEAPACRVELAFLEFMSPTLLEAGDRLQALGCRHVAVIPLFLGAGGHVRKDVPALLAALQAKHPDTRWTLCPAIGEQAEVLSAMANASLRMCAPVVLPLAPPAP